MRVPTVKLKHKDTGQEIVVNETDYALGSVPGVDLGGDWERVSETQGDAGANEMAADQRELVEKQKEKGKALDKKAKKGK